MFKPELLSPAGSLDKLKVAVSYGASAVYLAGQKFGLRSAAENFTLDELAEGIRFAHDRGVKTYIVLNSFLHDSDFIDLPKFIAEISELKVDAVIASDLGVIRTVQKTSNIPIHLSTQASCLNRYSANLWKKMGVQRLIFGREVSIKDAGRIKKESGLEVELFIHGSMCMAYSGNCTISNYTQGRDSNRGGCAQSCRFKYSLDTEHNSKTETIHDTAFMSSKDLNGLENINTFFDYEIDSLKIEGRMRSPMYAAIVSRVYREAIDTYYKHKELPARMIARLQAELNHLPNRNYTNANLMHPAQLDSINDHPVGSARAEPHFLGLVRAIQKNQYTLVEVRTGFNRSDSIEVISNCGTHIKIAHELQNSLGESIDRATPSSLVRLPYIPEISIGQVIRKSK